jgi:predicted alpha/beta-hydrolase family hydrolase
LNHLLDLPAEARALLILAHGAGSGMRHPFMADVTRALAATGIGVLRYEFPYMEQRKPRVDPSAVATARVREAVAEAARLAPGLPLLAGGKSFGGRMTSTAQAEDPLPGVRGLVFLGFPLHPPKRPSRTRAEHLDSVRLPMLFLQGTRDDLADLELIRAVCGGLGERPRLHVIEGADHSFRVPKRVGRDAGAVIAELAATIAAWNDGLEEAG